MIPFIYNRYLLDYLVRNRTNKLILSIYNLLCLVQQIIRIFCSSTLVQAIYLTTEIAIKLSSI